jgi:hypothetical protein
MTRSKLATKVFLLACLSVISLMFTIHFMVWFHRTGDIWFGISCAFCWVMSILCALAVAYRMKKLLTSYFVFHYKRDEQS